MREDAPETERIVPVAPNKNTIMRITSSLRASVVVLRLKRRDDRLQPYGEAYKEFNDRPAVFIHIPSFTLWVTSSYKEGGEALRCFRLGRNEAYGSEYHDRDINLPKYDRYCHYYENMLEVLENT